MGTMNRAFGGMQVIRIFLVIVFGAAALAGAGAIVSWNTLPVLRILAAVMAIPMVFLAALFAGAVSQAFREARQLARQEKRMQGQTGVRSQAAPTHTPAAPTPASPASRTAAPASVHPPTPTQSLESQVLAAPHTSTDAERAAYWNGIKHKSAAEREIARQEALIADEAQRLLKVHHQQQDGQS